MSEETQNPVEETLSAEEVQQRNQSIYEQRKVRCQTMISEGKKPYGQAYAGAQAIETVRTLFKEDQEVQVNIAGRIMSFRDMGKSIFAHVRDASGDIQIYAQKNVLGDEIYPVFKKLDIGDIIGVKGVLFMTHKGEITVKVHEYTLLSKILRPLPEKWHGLTDQEQRYRQRYVDLIVNPEAARTLKLRSQIIQELRNYLSERNYIEVETPMMQPIAGGAAATPFETYYNALSTKMYMRIATELYLKKLIVGGFEKVYEIGRIFRNEGLDKRHNPEFTTMELYQAYGDCRTMMDLMEGFITHIAEKLFGTLEIHHPNGRVIHLQRPWRRVNYDDLIREKAGADFFELPLEAMIEKAKVMDLDTEEMKSVDDVTKEIYEKTIEPTLLDPCFVTRLPKDFVPLAKTCEDDPRYVDVFELACNGYELAPGYSELNDPMEQYARFAHQAEAAGQNPDDVIDADFICALEYGMPPTGGIGIGIDRLAMMLTGAESIRDVLLFPQMKPRK